MRTSPAIQAVLHIAGRATPFVSIGGRAFVTVPADNLGFRAFPIRSRAFRDWFYAQYYADHETVPSAHAFSHAVHHLSAQAARDHRTTHVRVAMRVDFRSESTAPEKVLIDLADSAGQYIEITPTGWTLTNARGVTFETSSSSYPLIAPEPAGPGDTPLETLRATLNLGAPGSTSWRRVLAWILAALRPGGPYPVLVLRGPAACGKSTAARFLRALIDPSAAPFAPIPRTPRELFAIARQTWLLVFDSVAALPPAVSNALCRLCTGAGVLCSEPGLPDPVQLFLKRPILITADSDWTPPPALSGRALIVDLPPLAAADRRSEQDINAALLEAFPKILGAVCTAIQTALAATASAVPMRTRHLDALAWAMAATPALGTTPSALEDAFDIPPFTDPLIDSVLALLSPLGRWTGPATDLLPHIPCAKTPRVLSARLRDSILPLLEVGVQVFFDRSSGGRSRSIELSASQIPPPSLLIGSYEAGRTKIDTRFPASASPPGDTTDPARLPAAQLEPPP
jgi:hypothetical protein